MSSKVQTENLTRKGMGRPKGVPNKVNASMKQAIAEAFEQLGGTQRMVFCGNRERHMTRDALQKALEALESYDQYIQPLTDVFGGPPTVPVKDSTSYKVQQALFAIKEALMESPAAYRIDQGDGYTYFDDRWPSVFVPEKSEPLWR